MRDVQQRLGRETRAVVLGHLQRGGPPTTFDRVLATQFGAHAMRLVIEEQFGDTEGFRIFVLHHHLLPVPGTGRERNIVYDAGDAIECLQRSKVNLVLCGHKHVPYAWRLENLFVVNAGTVSSMRLRGNTRPCYNVIRIGDSSVEVWRKYPFHGRERIIQFCDELDTQAIRDIFPVGTPKEVAAKFKGFAEAGMRVFKVMDYGGMAGAKYAAKSAAKVIEVEDEVLRLCGDIG